MIKHITDEKGDDEETKLCVLCDAPAGDTVGGYKRACYLYLEGLKLSRLRGVGSNISKEHITSQLTCSKH